MSIGKIGRAVRSALDRTPGSGAVQRLIDKVRGPPSQSELELKSLVERKELEPDIGVDVPVTLDEKEIEQLCNISGLQARQRALIHGLPPPAPEKDYPVYHTFHYQRRLYARFGAASNINPGKLWPTPEELEHRLEKANYRYLMTGDQIHQEVKRIKEAEAARLAEIRARDEEIAVNVAKIDELKEKLYTEAVQAELELDKAEEKRNKRIEQVRKFFSYTLSVKDPRFKEKMVEMVQSEKDKQRKTAKAAKKEKLEAKKKAQELA